MTKKGIFPACWPACRSNIQKVLKQLPTTRQKHFGLKREGQLLGVDTATKKRRYGSHKDTQAAFEPF